MCRRGSEQGLLKVLKTRLICVRIKLPGVCVVMLFRLEKELGCISSAQGQAVAKGWWKQVRTLSSVCIPVNRVDTHTLDSVSFMQRLDPLS